MAIKPIEQIVAELIDADDQASADQALKSLQHEQLHAVQQALDFRIVCEQKEEQPSMETIVKLESIRAKLMEELERKSPPIGSTISSLDYHYIMGEIVDVGRDERAKELKVLALEALETIRNHINTMIARLKNPDSAPIPITAADEIRRLTAVVEEIQAEIDQRIRPRAPEQRSAEGANG